MIRRLRDQHSAASPFPSARARRSWPCCAGRRVDDQTLKADLEGKAKFLSSLVGDANLKGQVATARTDIFSKYPNAGSTRSDAYLEYMFCSFVLADPKWSAQDKFHAILEFRRQSAGDPQMQPGHSVTTGGNQSPVINPGGDVHIQHGSRPGAQSIEALPGNPTTPLPGPMPGGR